MANSAIVGILRALLTADTAEFDAAMKRAGDSAKDFSKEARTIGTELTKVGSALTQTITLPLAAVGAGAAKLAMDFESSFAGVRKTVDATDAEFAEMAQSFRNLAKEIPVNVNELNRLGEAAGALGIPKAEIVDFARVMAELGVTTNVTSDQAATSIAQIQTVFRAAGVDTDRFAATLVDLGNKGASTEQEILSLANRIASAGSAVGMSQAEVLGFASAIANVGIEAEAGGSAISKVFSDISIAVSHGGDAVKGFADIAGVSVADFSKLFKEDAAGAVLAFIEGLGRAKAAGGDLNLILEDLGFKEIRQARALRDLALSGDNLANSIRTANTAWEANTALTEEARKRFETTESQLTLLWNRLKDVGITLGNALLPMIKATIGVVTEFLPYLEKMAQGFADLPMPVQAIIVGLGALAAAAGPVLYVFGQLALSASAVAQAFTAKGVATKALQVAMSGLQGVVPVVAAAINSLSTSMGLGTVSVEGMTSALGLLGKAIAVVGTAMAAWQVGTWIGNIEGVKNSLATWALASDDLAAKLVRATMGMEQMSPAAAAAAVKATAAGEAAAKAGEGMDKAATAAQKLATANVAGGNLAKELNDIETAAATLQAQGGLTAQAMDTLGQRALALEKQGVAVSPLLGELADRYERMHPAVKKTGDATDAYSKALQNLQEQLSGKGLLETARQYETVVTAIGGASRLTTEEKIKYQKALDDVIAKYTAMGPAGQAVVDHYTALRAKLYDLPPVIREADVALTSLGTHIDIQPPTLEFTQFGLSVEDLQRKGLFASATIQELGFMMKALPPGIDASSTSMAKFRKEAEDSAISIGEAFQHTFEDLPNLLIKAFTGGGGFSGAISALTTTLTAELFGPNGPLESIKNGVAGMFGSSGLGAIVGQTIAAWLPGLGALIGPAIEGLKKLFHFGPSQEELDARQAYADWQAVIIQQFDEMATGAQKNEAAGEDWKKVNILVRDAYIEVGKTGEQAMTDIGIALDATHHSAEEVKEAVGRINDVLAEQKAHSEAVGTSMATLDETVKKYGFTIEELGPAMQRQRLSEQAEELYQDFQVLTAAGIDVATVTTRMSDSINEYVQNAVRTGTEVPSAMQPMIEKMIEMGLLTDENGNKITSLEGSGITFSETMTQGFAKVVESVKTLTKLIAEGLGIAFEDAGTSSEAAAQQMTDAFTTSSTTIDQANTTAVSNITARLMTLPGVTQTMATEMQTSFAAMMTNNELTADQKIAAISTRLQQLTGIGKTEADAFARQYATAFEAMRTGADATGGGIESVLDRLRRTNTGVTGGIAKDFADAFGNITRMGDQTSGQVGNALERLKTQNSGVAGGVARDWATTLGQMQNQAAASAYNIQGYLGSISAPTIYVPITYYDTNASSYFAAQGGFVTAFGVQRFAGGGEVLDMPMFEPRGTDTVPAMLTPHELVMTEADTGQIAATVESAASLAKAVKEAEGGRGGGPTNLNVTINAVDAASFEALVRRNPAVISQAAMVGLERGAGRERLHKLQQGRP